MTAWHLTAIDSLLPNNVCLCLSTPVQSSWIALKDAAAFLQLAWSLTTLWPVKAFLDWEHGKHVTGGQVKLLRIDNNPCSPLSIQKGRKEKSTSVGVMTGASAPRSSL